MMSALASVIFLFVLDQYIKKWALQKLYHTNIEIIENWFYLELYKNENIAFSLPLPQNILMPMIIVVIGVLLAYYVYSAQKRFGAQEYGLLLIIGGALGNLIDRLNYGAVIDYINFTFWPVFNLADAMISVGVVLIIISMFRQKK